MACTRSRSAVVVIVGLLVHAGAARAESESALLLPITMALAIASSAVEVQANAPAQPLAGLAHPPPPRRRVTLLPSRLQIPDGYALDCDRDPPMFAAPVGRNRLAALDLLGRASGHWAAALAADEESRHPLGHSSEVLRLVIDYRF